jgi:hypothetical protein
MTFLASGPRDWIALSKCIASLRVKIITAMLGIKITDVAAIAAMVRSDTEIDFACKGQTSITVSNREVQNEARFVKYKQSAISGGRSQIRFALRCQKAVRTRQLSRGCRTVMLNGKCPGVLPCAGRRRLHEAPGQSAACKLRPAGEPNERTEGNR